MTAKEYNALNDQQRLALRNLYDRNADGATYYTEFLARAYQSTIMDCIMVPWCGMQVGIETDGYTHS